MPKAKVKTGVAAMTAWWVSDGDEECPHCGQLYIYELEFRCPDCDSPACLHCKRKHAQGYHVCPECFEGADNG
jgi:predicted RNA-binding Zn-ribbon protein involved in translation (DUF1610 family)